MRPLAAARRVAPGAGLRTRRTIDSTVPTRTTVAPSPLPTAARIRGRAVSNVSLATGMAVPEGAVEKGATATAPSARPVKRTSAHSTRRARSALPSR